MEEAWQTGRRSGRLWECSWYSYSLLGFCIFVIIYCFRQNNSVWQTCKSQKGKRYFNFSSSKRIATSTSFCLTAQHCLAKPTHSNRYQGSISSASRQNTYTDGKGDCLYTMQPRAEAPARRSQILKSHGLSYKCKKFRLRTYFYVNIYILKTPKLSMGGAPS